MRIAGVPVMIVGRRRREDAAAAPTIIDRDAVDAHFANAGEPGSRTGCVEHTGPVCREPSLNGLSTCACAQQGPGVAELICGRTCSQRLAGFDQFPTATFAAVIATSWIPSSSCVPDRHDREFDSAQSAFDGLWELDLSGASGAM